MAMAGALFTLNNHLSDAGVTIYKVGGWVRHYGAEIAYIGLFCIDSIMSLKRLA